MVTTTAIVTRSPAVRVRMDLEVTVRFVWLRDCFNELNQNKNNPLKLLQYAEMLFEDLQEICDYAETISELWLAN